MRTIKLFTTIAAALAILALPIAAQAKDRGHGGRHGAHAQRAAGVVRSFRDGVLTIRLAGSGVKSAEVSDGTDLSCRTPPSARRRHKGARGRRARGHGARAATDPADDSGDDTGDDDDGADDTGDDDAGDDTGDDSADDMGDDDAEDDADREDPDRAGGRRRGKAGSCSPAALRRGARLKAARLSADGSGWAKLVLLRR